ILAIPSRAQHAPILTSPDCRSRHHRRRPGRPGRLHRQELQVRLGRIAPRAEASLHHPRHPPQRRAGNGAQCRNGSPRHRRNRSRLSFRELVGPGKLLDTARYFIVLPDDIGHGGSSKPSNGLHAKFPHYDYDDMVNAEHLLLTEGLQVNHLRLVMGTSMGCMHAWVWGYLYPAFADGLVPLACVPAQIAGRNRMIRTMIMDDITDSPDYNGGEYSNQPHGLRAAIGQLYIMSSAPLVQHKQAPTRDRADSVVRRYIDNAMKTTDANDMLYYFNSSRNYDPSSHLEQITTPVLAIN